MTKSALPAETFECASESPDSVLFEVSTWMSLGLADATGKTYPGARIEGISVAFRVNDVMHDEQGSKRVSVRLLELKVPPRAVGSMPGTFHQAVQRGWVLLGEPVTIRLDPSPCLWLNDSCHPDAVEQSAFVEGLAKTLELRRTPELRALEGRSREETTPIVLPASVARSSFALPSQRGAASAQQAQPDEVRPPPEVLAVMAHPDQSWPEMVFAAELEQPLATSTTLTSEDGAKEERVGHSRWLIRSRMTVDRACRLRELEVSHHVRTPPASDGGVQPGAHLSAVRTTRWRLTPQGAEE